MKTTLKAILEKIKVEEKKVEDILANLGDYVQPGYISIGDKIIGFNSEDECSASIQSSVDKVFKSGSNLNNLKALRNWFNAKIIIQKGYFKGKRLIDVLMVKELITKNNWYEKLLKGFKRLEKDEEFKFSKVSEEKTKELAIEIRELSDRMGRNGKSITSEEFKKQKEELEQRYKVKRVSWSGLKKLIEELSLDVNVMLPIIEEAIQSANTIELELSSEEAFEEIEAIQIKSKLL